MIDANLKQQLASLFERLTQKVDITVSGDDSEAGVEMQSMLAEIASISSLISVVPAAAPAARRPSFTIGRAGEAARVEFAGVPTGHEFSSLVLALLQAGGHPPRVEQAVLDQIRSLDGDFRFEVYISLSCQNCPEVVQALNLLAIQNPRIRATMIDGALFQSEVDQKQIMAVPSVYLNGEPFGQGRMGVEEILAKVDSRAGERQAAEIAARAPFDMLVVGGGPAGGAAAIYAARKGIRTGLVAERFGGQLLDTLAVENFISVKETDGPHLAAGLEQHVRGYDVDIMNLQRAEALLPADAAGRVGVRLANGAELRSRAIVLATGARWRELNVPGEREYRGRGVAYCPHCDGPLFKGKRVAVIGGGNSGVEAAIDLAGIVGHVTLVEFDGKLRADEVLQRKLRSLPNVRIIVSAQTTEVHGADGKVVGLSYKDRGSGDIHRVELEGVFVQIGLLPNTDWLKGSVKLSPRGEIEIDERGQTSMAGVFAAGDATTVPYKQIVVAMGEGSRAALGAFDWLIRSSAPAESANAA
jgi:alkyl hydroperoxide reductase subunit F